MLGVARGTVKLSKHNPKWTKIFEKEKELLQKYGEVEHVGSTSVPDLEAKPILDIAIGIKNLDYNKVKKLKKPLSKLGYHYMREDRPNEYLFTKGPEKNRTHYLHMIEFGKRAWNEYINFREYLKNNSKARKEYSVLKNKLATEFAADRKSYTKGKIELIQKFIGESLKND